MAPKDTNGWDEWKNLVLDKLDTLKSMDERLDTMAVEVARLKVFASLWGGIAGLFGSLAVALVLMLVKSLL